MVGKCRFPLHPLWQQVHIVCVSNSKVIGFSSLPRSLARLTGPHCIVVCGLCLEKYLRFQAGMSWLDKLVGSGQGRGQIWR